jgi:hypothetical protein
MSVPGPQVMDSHHGQFQGLARGFCLRCDVGPIHHVSTQQIEHIADGSDGTMLSGRHRRAKRSQPILALDLRQPLILHLEAFPNHLAMHLRA